MTGSLIVFTFILTLSLVLLFINRRLPDRTRADEVSFYLILFIGWYMISLISYHRLILDSGILHLLPLGYFYGPVTYLILFTRRRENLSHKEIIFHGLPFLFALLITCVVFLFWRNDEMKMFLVFSYLKAGVLISITSYIIYGVVSVSGEDKNNPFLRRSQRLGLIFWVICLLAFLFWKRTGIVNLESMKIAEALDVCASVFMFFVLLYAYRQYIHRIKDGVQDPGTTRFYFDSKIIDQEARSAHKKEDLRIYRETNSVSSELISDKIDYLNPDMDLSTFAKEMQYSDSYLNKQIQKETGLTFKSYINKQRIEEAKIYLSENPDCTMKDLMAHSGFKSQATFYRNFKNHTGLTPGKYLEDL